MGIDPYEQFVARNATLAGLTQQQELADKDNVGTRRGYGALGLKPSVRKGMSQ